MEQRNKPARRSILTGGVALAAASRGAEAADAKPSRIDFHHHVVPPVYRETLAKQGIAEVGGVPFPAWTPAQMFQNMDTLRISKALMSISSPGVYFGDAAFADDLARRSNDALAELRTGNPKRLGAFASLPLPDIDRSLAEYERIRSQLKFEGVTLLTNFGGKYLGHKDYAPMLAELDRHKALVFLHPNLPAGLDALSSMSLPPPVLEFVFDTTRTLADMIFTGTFDRYPNIRWVTSHLAGALPYIAWRLSMIETSPRQVYAAFRERGRSVKDYMKGLYYDTAVSASPASLSAILDIVGPDRLVFGSDVPHAAFDFVQATSANLDAFTGLDAKAQVAVASGNGERLLAAA